MVKAAVILIALTGILAPACRAQSDDLSWIVELLDSPDWAVREAFTRKLEHDRHIDLREIETLMHDEALSAEVRLRLSAVAKVRFFRTSRAAVGMGTQDNSSLRYGVIVGDLQPGFDARRVLRTGDRLIQAQGRVVRNWDRFRALILSNDPGDQFDVVVVRDGETLELSFTLGEYTRLRTNNAMIDPMLLDEAWQIRVSNTSAEQPPSADTGYAAEPLWRQDKMAALADWPDDDVRRGSTTRRLNRAAPLPTVEAAGAQALFDWGQLQRIGVDVSPDRDALSNAQQLEIYRTYLANQQAIVDGLESRLEDPNLDDRTRRSIVARIERMKPGLNHIKRWIAEAEREQESGG